MWYHSFDGSWWLGKVKQPHDDRGRYIIRFLDNPDPALIALPGSAYNTALHAPCGSWCIQTRGRWLTCTMAICPPSGTLCLLPDTYVYVKSTSINATDRYIKATNSNVNAKESLHSATTRHQDLLYTTVVDFFLFRNYKLCCSRNSFAARRYFFDVRRV